MHGIVPININPLTILQLTVAVISPEVWTSVSGRVTATDTIITVKVTVYSPVTGRLVGHVQTISILITLLGVVKAYTSITREW